MAGARRGQDELDINKCMSRSSVPERHSYATRLLSYWMKLRPSLIPSPILAGRTGIVVAHRLATLEEVDYLLLLEGGRVVEFGLREVLAQNPDSHYSHLRQVGLLEVLT